MPKTTLAYMRYHWEDAYTFEFANGKYSATAKFGAHELLTADDPDNLLIKIRRHYPGTRTDLAST